MAKRNIIVIGASAGGFDAIKTIVASLPDSFDASIFIVWHISPDVLGIMPKVLNGLHTLPAVNATDKDPIQTGRIYVAPPDHHLVLEPDRMRITKGPKENRFRPAIDPLFRSAAFAFGERVIGVILSGALDDGTAGLWSIKQRGGVAIVQDVLDAEVRSMPENAIQAVDVDHIAKAADIAPLLVKLIQEDVNHISAVEMEDNKKTKREIDIALENGLLTDEVFSLGQLTAFTCPECHGVLTAIKEGSRVRFRCHTWHAFTADSLLAALTENIEDIFWNAIRSIKESVMLLNHMGDHFAEVNQPREAAAYFNKAKEAEARAKAIREVLGGHEQLSAETVAFDVSSSITEQEKKIP